MTTWSKLKEARRECRMPSAFLSTRRLKNARLQFHLEIRWCCSRVLFLTGSSLLGSLWTRLSYVSATSKPRSALCSESWESSILASSCSAAGSSAFGRSKKEGFPVRRPGSSLCESESSRRLGLKSGNLTFSCRFPSCTTSRSSSGRLGRAASSWVFSSSNHPNWFETWPHG